MNNKILNLELACLFSESKKIEEIFEKDSDLKSIFLSYIKGDYFKSLTNFKDIKNLLDIKSKSSPKEMIEQIQENITTFLKDSNDSEQSEFLILLTGILCLNLFIQNNYTGPFLKDLNIAPFDVPKDFESYIIKEMSIGGETINIPTYSITYLYLGKLFLERKDIKSLTTYSWWKARCLLIHNKSLSYKVDTLLKQTKEAFEETTVAIKDLNYKNGELIAHFLIEKGLMLAYYFQEIEAQQCFEQARKETGLSMELSASLGVRTKFQTSQVSQLVLFAESLGKDEEKGEAPKEVELEEDSILLSKPKLEKDSESNLRIIDQIIILAFCLNIKNQNARHGLTSEEMFPYIRRVGIHPNNWMVHTQHLLIKSRLERESNKTVERSVIQFQVITEQFYDETPSVAERIKYIYSLSFPSVYDLNKELGDRLMGVGALNSALQIFERLNMYEEMIQCLLAVERSGKAEEIVNQRLEKDIDDFRMIYLLGMIKDDPELYEKAWEKSGKRYARAKRALGNYYMKRKMYKECIPHYETALSINYLYPLTWFSYGCACMFISEFEKAINAYQKVVQQNPEDSDSWSNMGTCYIQLNKLNEAFKTLKEATKIKYDSWKIWENFLWISLQVEQFGEAFMAIRRIIELNPLRLEAKYFNMLIKVMKYHLQDKENDYGVKFRAKLNEILIEATNKLPGDAKLWQSFVSFYEEAQFFNQEAKIVELILKQIRALKKEGWERSKENFESVANAVIKLWNYQVKICESKEKDEKNKIKSSTQMEVNSILKAVNEHFPDHELYKKLSDLLENFDWKIE